MQRILIYGTSPAVGTGYGQVVKAVASGLKARGYEPFIFAWNGHAGGVLSMNGVPIYPRGSTLPGHDILGSYVKYLGADTVLAVCDPWIMSLDHWRFNNPARLVFWYPVQSEPASPKLLELVNGADLGLCYSQWGLEIMREAGNVNSHYVPLGIDTDVYKPLDRQECREWFGERLGFDLADRFLVGMVAANSFTIPIMRKAFDQAFIAFRDYLDYYDSDAVMYVHTTPNELQGGTNLLPLLNALGLEAGRHVFFPNQVAQNIGLGNEWMAKMYNACDVMSQATCAEGFGLPVIEAQACGTPVIATNNSTMPELVRGGALVESVARIWAGHPVDGWVYLPDSNGIRKAMRDLPEIYNWSAGVNFAKQFSWDRVIDDYLLPALGETDRTVPAVELMEAVA